jgi:hypothetical protein
MQECINGHVLEGRKGTSIYQTGTLDGRSGRILDELAGSPRGDVWVWAYGLRLFNHTLALAHTVFATPLPLLAPIWTNGTYSGRTGSLPDKRAGSPRGDVWVWAYGLRLLTTRLPLPTPFLPHPRRCSHRFWTNGTYSG